MLVLFLAVLLYIILEYFEKITYYSFAHKWKVFLFTHCPEICVRKEISRPGYLEVNWYSVVHPIDLRRVFLRYVNISTRIFGDSVSCPGLYGVLYGQNLPYKFKTSYGDFTHRNFVKSHRTTGPRSDLRAELWSWVISGLETTSGTSKSEVFRWRPGLLKRTDSITPPAIQILVPKKISEQ
jgi:hypothetical protein